MFTHTLSCKRASDGESTWAKFDVHIYHEYPVIFKVCPLYNGSALLLFTCKLHCLQTFEHTSALGHQSLGVCDVSYTSTRVFEILRETCKRCMLLFTNL